MLIMISGPYSARSAAEREENLLAMNRLAVAVLRRGHVPVVGVNAALNVAALLDEAERYEAIMKISLALAEACDGVLMLAESPGATREREVFERTNRPVYLDVNDIPG